VIRDYHTGRPGGARATRRRDALPWVRRLFKLLLVLLVLSASAVGLWEGYRRMLRLPYFRVAEIRVEGNLQVASEDVVVGLGLSPESSILEVNLEALAQRVLRNPWIKEASVRRQLPLSLTVRVVERMPEAVFIADRRYLLSADGVILAALEPDDLPTLPTLRAIRPRHVRLGERVLDTEMVQGLAVWRQFQLANALQGEMAHEITIVGDGSYVVNLGEQMPVIRLRAQDLPEQLRRLGAALLASGKSLDRFKDVDLRFRDRVVFRPVAGG
jgi:POTRA domain-containing FtsQ-type protein